MFLRKKAQSTAEYAILLALVAAVAGGILQVSLRGAIREKNTQAVNFLLDAGNSDADEFANAAVSASDIPLYTQEYRQTTIKGGAANYKDITVMKKGGLEKREKLQTQETATHSVETLDSDN
jgi:hypothetical protein